MKGDFSRLRFRPGKGYTSVIEQQGRVALDADANEQCAIDNYLRDTEARDVIGPYGAPIGDAGFQITVQGNTLVIGAGRYYVSGILCENSAALPYSEQPFLIKPSATDTALLNSLHQGSITTIQLFLQVWQRLATSLDDPCLREPALGQADTTARLQTAWRVVAQSVAAPTSSANAWGLSALASSLVANDFNASATLANAVGSLAAVPVSLNCCAQMEAPQPAAASTGTMGAQTGGSAADCSCEPTPAAGYRGIENQLYRVEIHQGGDQSAATFKWSRENGSVVVAVSGVSGRQVYVDSLGPDANLGFAAGEWVEISDDSFEFGQTPNLPGDLYQIQSVDPQTLCVTMTSAVASVDAKLNARMRRWEQFGTGAKAHGVSLSAGIWLDLENGIQVQFSSGQYHTGDYWLIPARTATGQIDWPPCGGNGDVFQAPHSIHVFVAPLACIQWNPRTKAAAIQDCRKIFSPLTALAPEATANALHVTKINWANDDVTTLDQLVANGLVVTLDQAPAGTINGANFAVTFENPAVAAGDAAGKPLSSFSTATETLSATLLRGVSIIDSMVTVSGSTMSWQMPYLQANAAQRAVVAEIQTLISLGAATWRFTRVRVRLLGRAIFGVSGSQQLFLDGQSFGQAAVRADGLTQRINLQLPSGDSEKASDFESWFYVAPTLMLVSVTVNYSAFTVVVNSNNVITQVEAIAAAGAPLQAVTPQATVTVSYPAIAATVVNLALSGASGVNTVASIPSTVTLAQNQTTATFPINILSNPVPGTTLTFQITASLNSALGPVGAQSVSFTVTGGAPPVVFK